jgi:hypothetical protein
MAAAEQEEGKLQDRESGMKGRQAVHRQLGSWGVATGNQQWKGSGDVKLRHSGSRWPPAALRQLEDMRCKQSSSKFPTCKMALLAFAGRWTTQG